MLDEQKVYGIDDELAERITWLIASSSAGTRCPCASRASRPTQLGHAIRVSSTARHAASCRAFSTRLIRNDHSINEPRTSYNETEHIKHTFDMHIMEVFMS